MSVLAKNLLAKSLCAICLAAVGGIAFAAPSDGTQITFSGTGGITLDAAIYKPDNVATRNDWPAVVMLHGCSGMWSNKVFGASSGGHPNLQKHIESWGRYLADHGYIAIAVDSFHSHGDPQDQCGGLNLTDPYTERVQDARDAYAYLVGLDEVSPGNVGLLAWSQGAEAAMVEASATVYNSTTLRPAGDHLFATTVTFYPGCGTNMKFGPPTSSWWRPANDFRMYVGVGDNFSDNCTKRITSARDNYGSTARSGHEASVIPYDGADHSFDYDGREILGMVDTAFPTGQQFVACSIPVSVDTEECAMIRADWNGMSFLNAHLQ